MKNQKTTLVEILKILDGVNKIEAYDIVHKLEALLFYASSPLDTNNLKQIMSSGNYEDEGVDPFHFTILPNGNFCEFDGSNDWLHIYKENKRFLPNWPMFNTYYFKTKYAPLELLKLTKKNILENIQNTEKESEIRDFLKKSPITKKNMITDKLLILER